MELGWGRLWAGAGVLFRRTEVRKQGIGSAGLGCGLEKALKAGSGEASEASVGFWFLGAMALASRKAWSGAHTLGRDPETLCHLCPGCLCSSFLVESPFSRSGWPERTSTCWVSRGPGVRCQAPWETWKPGWGWRWGWKSSLLLAHAHPHPLTASADGQAGSRGTCYLGWGDILQTKSEDSIKCSRVGACGGRARAEWIWNQQ